MKEAAIIAGILVVGYLLLKKGSVTATVTTPTDGVPGTDSPPPPAPPPPYYGGTGGTVGSGGIGLGGPVVAGVSPGTATTLSRAAQQRDPSRTITVQARDPSVVAARNAGLTVLGSRMPVVIG